MPPVKVFWCGYGICYRVIETVSWRFFFIFPFGQPCYSRIPAVSDPRENPHYWDTLSSALKTKIRFPAIPWLSNSSVANSQRACFETLLSLLGADVFVV